MEKEEAKLFLFFCLACLAIGASISLSIRVHADTDTMILDDSTITWTALDGSSASIFGPVDLAPGKISYTADQPFEITEVAMASGADFSANNHEGLGYVHAAVYDTQGKLLSASINSCYGEGGCGPAVFDFPPGVMVPAQFEIGFTVSDLIQGGSNWSLSDVTVYGIPESDVREPVVLVPGIMGSELDRVSDGKELWPDVTDMISSFSDSYLDALKLPGDPIDPSDIIREATGTVLGFIPVDQAFFEPLITALTSAGYTEGTDLFPAPYDWRLDIADSAARVGAVIQNALAHSPDGKVDIIAHSMGGLVVKDYLAQTPDTSFVRRLIFAGVPQLGAPFMFKALEYGDNLGFGLGPFNVLDPAEVKSISQNMPAAYQLLPSRRYVDVEGSYVIDARGGSGGSTVALSFDQTNQFLTSDPGDARNGTLLAAADTFHAPLDDASVNAPTVYNLVGCGNAATVKSYILGDDGAVDIVRGNGDGSVPVDSAMDLADGYQNYFFLNPLDGVDHTGLIRDPPSIALIQAILQGSTSTLSLEPLGVSRDTADCLAGHFGSGDTGDTTIEVSVQGDAELDVYDNAGNHTGPTSDGDTEAKIPGSQYEMIGKNSFVLLPASSTYRVSTHASSTTVLTIKIKHYDSGANLRKTTKYPPVPVTGASTTVTLALAGPTSTSTLPLMVQTNNNATSTAIQPLLPVAPAAIPQTCNLR